MDATTYAAYGLAIIGLCMCLMLASLLIASAFAVFRERRAIKVSSKPNRWMQERQKHGLK